MSFERDSDELKKALQGHSVEGYKVSISRFGQGTIVRQQLTGPGAIFYVRLDKPVPFDSYANMVGADTTPLTETELRARRPGRTLAVPASIAEALERGESVSEKDIEFAVLMDMGCLDSEQRVVCLAAPWNQTTIAQLKRGMLVEYSEGEGRELQVWAGRIVGSESKGEIALLELFEPVTFMRTPSETAADKIRKGFYSSLSWSYGPGLYEALEKKKQPIPAGKWTEDEREWLLQEPVELERVQSFCKQFYPKSEPCSFLGMVMFIVPIQVSGGGRFHPLREDRVGYYEEEVEVEYE